MAYEIISIDYSKDEIKGAIGFEEDKIITVPSIDSAEVEKSDKTINEYVNNLIG